ncbi:MAG TPA: TonB-dependent receptor [Phenylobacterium sp.]|jgi:iron complex outermembrane receptor protein|uniref:TonB-dependent receptor plug domain-containing protein n=1 Tax=Phenylobacterium sp. TaxID=1871053 RepID=UPI002C939016|nr:TonB-dependent receptor [Phenylobacterium sp.]HXA39124.1 TonB-dependent receptor [Phenylobacterium sp.]
MRSLYMGASVLVLSAFIAPAASAAAAPAEAAAGVSEVIVTGTRQTGLKAADSAAPVEVLGSDALKRVGQPDLIQSLTQNLPSFNSESFGTDTGQLTLSAQLRGLNPNNTLVLVDGKRRHSTGNLHVAPGVFQGAATPDLGLIPVGAIDHVEVLQDGAAAQYGSDAIAGVVNIIMKTANHGGTISATGGSYYTNGGATGAASANIGLPLGDKGFLNLTAETRYHDFSHQGGADRRLFNLDGSLKAGLDAVDAAGVKGAPDYPRVNHIYGDASSNLYNGFYNAGYELGEGVQLYSFGSYSHRKASAFENYRLPSRVIASPVLGVGGSVTTPGELIPFPNGFNPREALREDDYSVTGGIKGVMDEWNWDLSTTYGRDKNEISTLNSANASLFIDTHTTPRNFYDGAFVSSEWTGNLDISRGFDVGMASPLNLAFGAEGRRETYDISTGDPASIYKEGGQSYPGFQPSDAANHSRTNYAGYIDLAVDPIAGLKVDLAGRYEHYSDFGSTTVGKLTGRYDFNPAFAIRGTVSTGFRAPTLAEEFYSATNVAPTFAVVNLPPNSPAAHLVGFQNLKPEKSTNYSIGFVAHPIERLQITADAYQIEIRNRIVNTGTLLGLLGTTVVSQGALNAIRAHGNILDPSVTYVGIAVFTNGANTRTRGVELTANYASDFDDYGHVDWSAAVNYNETTITSLQPLPALVANAAFSQTSILSPTARSTLTSASPKEKAVLGAYWTKGRWSVNLREEIYGEVSEIIDFSGAGTDPEARKFTVPATGITDLDVGFNLTDSVKIDVGANNLFSKRPPGVPNVPDGSGGVRPLSGNNVYGEPAQFSPYGINGGYYYGRLTFTF